MKKKSFFMLFLRLECRYIREQQKIVHGKRNFLIIDTESTMCESVCVWVAVLHAKEGYDDNDIHIQSIRVDVNLFQNYRKTQNSFFFLLE